jgi:hypothetical protein
MISLHLWLEQPWFHANPQSDRARTFSTDTLERILLSFVEK